VTAVKNLPVIGALAVLALASLGLAACGPMVMQAPFSSRPDTMDPGDLLGSFDGIVVDAESERPIPEATVQATWSFERGIGLVGPAGEQTVATQTNPDGRYEIARLTSFPSGASARVARFTLVVYRRGYAVWRSDQLFPTPGLRHDFSQRKNRIRLVQWKDGWSHSRHLVFMGSGASIKKAAAWERQPASIELSPAGTQGSSTNSSGEELLDASQLLVEADVRSLNNYADPLTASRLVDLPRSEFYDSVHFASQSNDERFDVAVRLWRLGPVAGPAQYRKLLADLPSAQPVKDLGDTAVKVASGDVRASVFAINEAGLVVSVTCGIGHCPEESNILTLSKLVHSRLGSLDKKASVPGALSDPFAPSERLPPASESQK